MTSWHRIGQKRALEDHGRLVFAAEQHRVVDGQRRSARLLAATVVVDLAVLAVWKYAGFASDVVHDVAARLDLDTPVVAVALPIGISFFTFHHLSYVVDVHRGTRPPMRNPLTFTAYIAMFPQLIAGPIVRYHEIDRQLPETDRDKLDDFAAGFPRFALALTKKVVITDAL